MKIDHIGIATEQIDEALKFYRDALGLEVAEVEEVPSQKVRVAMLPVGESPHEVFVVLESLGCQQPAKQPPCPGVLRRILRDDVFAHRDLRTMLFDQRTDVVTLGLERQSGERARNRHARGKRRVLVHRESFLVEVKNGKQEVKEVLPPLNKKPA